MAINQAQGRARKPVRAGDRRSKVQAGHWIAAARRTLCRQGVEAVRIERLAKQLGISRGSFYIFLTRPICAVLVGLTAVF